jgi:hypothetical protein
MRHTSFRSDVQDGSSIIKVKLEAMRITSAFNERRTSTTVSGELFAAVCRHPEDFVPAEIEK